MQPAYRYPGSHLQWPVLGVQATTLIYEFWCDTCEEITAFKHTMKEGPPFMPLCFECEVPMQRIYALPQLITSYESAADVMNKALAGQGDPMPGMTRAQTQHAAPLHPDPP